MSDQIFTTNLVPDVGNTLTLGKQGSRRWNIFANTFAAWALANFTGQTHVKDLYINGAVTTPVTVANPKGLIDIAKPDIESLHVYGREITFRPTFAPWLVNPDPDVYVSLFPEYVNGGFGMRIKYPLPLTDVTEWYDVDVKVMSVNGTAYSNVVHFVASDKEVPFVQKPDDYWKLVIVHPASTASLLWVDYRIFKDGVIKYRFYGAPWVNGGAVRTECCIGGIPYPYPNFIPVGHPSNYS